MLLIHIVLTFIDTLIAGGNIIGRANQGESAFQAMMDVYAVETEDLSNPIGQVTATASFFTSFGARVLSWDYALLNPDSYPGGSGAAAEYVRNILRYLSYFIYINGFARFAIAGISRFLGFGR